MRAAGICEAPAGWQKGGGAPPLWPWALGEGAWTTKLPLIVGKGGGPPGVPPSLYKGSVPLLFQGASGEGAHRVLSGRPGLSHDQQELEAPLRGLWDPGFCPAPSEEHLGTWSLVMVLNCSYLRFHRCPPCIAQMHLDLTVQVFGVEN